MENIIWVNMEMNIYPIRQWEQIKVKMGFRIISNNICSNPYTFHWKRSSVIDPTQDPSNGRTFHKGVSTTLTSLCATTRSYNS